MFAEMRKITRKFIPRIGSMKDAKGGLLLDKEEVKRDGKNTQRNSLMWIEQLISGKA